MSTDSIIRAATKSHIIKPKCQYCGATIEEKSKIVAGLFTISTLACGHNLVVKRAAETDAYSLVTSDDGKKLFAYQVEDCKRAREANFRCLFNHEYAVGKTVISMGLLKAHKELQPALFIVKSGLMIQYFKEIMRWTGYLAQVLRTGKDKPVLGFKAYIVSYGLVGKLDWSLVDIRSVFLDECQYIKNRMSQRSKAVTDFCSNKQHIIATSNTPIKNNASEYFPILNILDPINFHNETGFISRYVDFYNDGYRARCGGLNRWHADEFRKKTESYIFRRKRDEVFSNDDINNPNYVPKIFRRNTFVDLDDKDLAAAYEQQANKFAMEFDGDLSVGSTGIAMLSRLRHICGLNKLSHALEEVENFLISVPDEKITVFVHHKDVGEMLYSDLKSRVCDGSIFAAPLRLTSEMSLEARNEAIEAFKLPANRVLIASTLAAGEGLNLQFCSNAMILERQWNPANEEQAEGRFPRPGSKAARVDINYMVAVGTIDEYLTEIVERKRQYVANTLDGKESVTNWEESSIMQELAQKLVAQQRKKWSLK